MSEIDAQEQFFNRLPVPAFTVNAALRVVWWSDAMVALTGCQRESIQGRPVWGAFSAERIATPVERACILGEDHEEYLTFTHQGSGIKTSTRWRVRPHVDGEGCIQGASAVVEEEAPQGATVELQAVAPPDPMAGVFQSMVDDSPTPMMLCDIHDNFKITYCNAATEQLLRQVQSSLPVRAERIMGQSIDIFHKNPQRIRNLLMDPSNLPVRSRNKLGEDHFDVHVHAVRNKAGEYVGAALLWDCVTEQVKLHERQTSSLKDVEKIQHALGQLARGDISVRVDEPFQGPLDPMRQNFNEIAGVLRDFRDEFARLSAANERGQTAVRANAAKFSGELAGIMGQVNHMLDVVQGPVEALQRHLGMMAAGDLRVVISEEYQGDHAALKDAYNRSLASLNEILNSVKGGAQQIGRSASEIAAASQQVSEGASAQAAAIEEISAQMAEMTSKTDENARNAAQANHLVASARSFASEGDKQMTAMIASMNEINEASQSISSIIKVIDEIAFQTNLLALNAAVEAARAGVHGKGFAVVAEEVRNLAARSAQAARETTELIKGSAKTVNQGMVIASQTAEALSSIVSGVTQVSELVARIASASREQAQGIGQVNLGLEQINEVTLANTAGAEQSATATRQLRQLVEELQGMLSRFQLQAPVVAAPQGFPSWVTPEMLRALQSMVPGGGAPAPHQHKPAAASGGQRPGSFIHLGEQDFGKY